MERVTFHEKVPAFLLARELGIGNRFAFYAVGTAVYGKSVAVLGVWMMYRGRFGSWLK